jgi:hypothetical protein
MHEYDLLFGSSSGEGTCSQELSYTLHHTKRGSLQCSRATHPPPHMHTRARAHAHTHTHTHTHTHNNTFSYLQFRQNTHLLNSATLGTHWNTENYLCLAISHFKTRLRISCRIYSSLKRSSKQKCDEHVSLCAVNSNWRKKYKSLSSQFTHKNLNRQ